MSKTNSAVLRSHFHWLLDQRSASNRETTLRIYLKIMKRLCVRPCESTEWTQTLFHREKNIYSQVFHPLDHPRYEHFINPLWLYYRVSFFHPLYSDSCGYKCNMNPASNAKPNNGTLKILIASLPTHSYEHTHTHKNPPKLSSSNKATTHTNYSSPGMSSSHHFVCFFFSLLFILFHPALFVFYFVLYSCNLI